MKKNNKAYISYFDTISCGGNNAEELFQNICEKKQTISIIDDFIEGKSVALGKIPNSYDMYEELEKRCKILLEKSNIEDFSDTFLIIASSVGGMNTSEKIFFRDGDYKNIDYNHHSIDAIAYKLRNVFNFYDDVSFSTACTSAANALGYAKEVLHKGIYKNVLVIGAETLSFTTVFGFDSLSVLSSKPCKPFDISRDGMNVSEGIGIVFLQNEITDNTYVELCGVGYSSDAYHMTAPSEDGYGAKLAMQNAIDDAKIQKNQIDYINAHGTATQANDTAEINAIKSLFEGNIPFVSSTKSITGHTLGAAGAIEAIISSQAIIKGVIPPNNNLNDKITDEVFLLTQPLKKEIKYVLSNSFAFGGNNCCLVLGSVK